jgi:hypothetical protein
MRMHVLDQRGAPRVYRPMIVGTQSWTSVIERYRRTPIPAMAELAAAIAGSPHGHELYPLTSMHDLLISQFPEFEWNREVLRIRPLEWSDLAKFRLRFEFTEEPFPTDRHWTYECPVEEGYRRFERFLQLQKWFLDPPVAPAG